MTLRGATWGHGLREGRRGRRGIVAAAALVALLAVPAATMAGAPAGASDDPCGLGTAVATAGRPLALSGSLTDPQAFVAISARNAEGAFREGNVWSTATTWRASLTFRPGDAGTWTVDLAVDGRHCTTTLAVVLPDGVTAPPHETPTEEELFVTRPPAITTDGVLTATALGATALVTAAWLFLGLIAIGGALGLRPLARGGLLGPTRVAVFVAVLGAFAAAYLFAWFMISMSHFGTRIPPDQEAALRIGLGVTLVVGCVVGARSARRVVALGTARAR